MAGLYIVVLQGFVACSENARTVVCAGFRDGCKRYDSFRRLVCASVVDVRVTAPLSHTRPTPWLAPTKLSWFFIDDMFKLAIVIIYLFVRDVRDQDMPDSVLQSVFTLAPVLVFKYSAIVVFQPYKEREHNRLEVKLIRLVRAG